MAPRPRAAAELISCGLPEADAILGGGLPVGAYGGKASLMKLVAPSGPGYQAGTLSGKPLAVAAGSKTLEVLRRPGTYERLEALGKRLEEGLLERARQAGLRRARCVLAAGHAAEARRADGKAIVIGDSWITRPSDRDMHNTAYKRFVQSQVSIKRNVSFIVHISKHIWRR